MPVMEQRTSRTELKLRSEANDNGNIGTLTGYISKFNDDSLDLGGFIEQVAPGAFADSLTRNDVVCLVNHDHSAVVGRMSNHTLRLEEDSVGLKFECDLPPTQIARDLKTLVERGDVIGCSFGFQTDKESWPQRDDGKQLCILERINLFECSVGVTWPAYDNTSMQMRDRLKDHRENLRKRYREKLELRRPLLV